MAPEDKEKIEKLVEETVTWLDTNQLAEVDELEHKLKELEGQCSPIISKIYGGAEGAAPGAGGPMPDMPQPGAGASASSQGPKIEVGVYSYCIMHLAFMLVLLLVQTFN